MEKDKYSGKFVLRVPMDLHKQLKTQAQKSFKSLNQFCVEKLSSSIEIQSPLIRALKDFFKDELIAVYQFGSSVRGEATSNSDIDILCVVNPNHTITRQLYKDWDSFIYDLGLNPKYSIHFVHLLKDSNNAGSLWLEVALEGACIYDPNFEVNKMLIRLRELIISQNYKRNFSHGHPFWIKDMEKDYA